MRNEIRYASKGQFGGIYGVLCSLLFILTMAPDGFDVMVTSCVLPVIMVAQPDRIRVRHMARVTI